MSEQLRKMTNRIDRRHSTKTRRSVALEQAAERDEILSAGEGMLLLSALSAVIVSILTFALF